MKPILFCVFIFVSCSSYAQQDTIFINKQNKETTRDSADFFRFKEVKDELTFVKDYFMSGTLQMTGSYSSFKPPMKQGAFMYYSKDGVLKSENYYVDNKQAGKQKSYFDSGKLMTTSDYSDGKLNGEFVSYNSDGIIKRREQYENGKMTSGKCYDIAGGDTTYYAFEIMPEFPGGNDALLSYLSTNIKYPKKARRKDITGRVYITFVVDKEGNVKDARVLRGVDPLLDETALEVVKNLPKWQPGRQDGKPVNVQYNLPVSFNLRN